MGKRREEEKRQRKTFLGDTFSYSTFRVTNVYEISHHEISKYFKNTELVMPILKYSELSTIIYFMKYISVELFERLSSNKLQSVVFFVNLRFNPFLNKPCFLRVYSTSLLKTVWENETLLVSSNFCFSHSVFYLFGELSAIYIHIEIVVCKLFHFGRI